jgi:hypothetical protein
VIDHDDTVKVKIYDRAGRLLSQFGRKGLEDNEFDDPYRVAVRNDSIFVLDLARFSRLPAFDSSGAYLGSVAWKNERMPTDMRATPEGFVITTTVSGREGDTRQVAKLIDRAGASRGEGCRIDPAIIASEQRGEMLGAFVFSRIEQRAGRVYCSQPSTPVVQVINERGTLVDSIVDAPPFYVAPPREKMTTNSKKATDYTAKFTMHLGLVPTGDGFVSIYRRFDPVAGRLAYSLFACRGEGAQRRCGTVSTPREILHIAEPDTIYIAEESPDHTQARLGIYRLTGLGGGRQ